MHTSITSAPAALLAAARRFADEVVAPQAALWERERRIGREALGAAATLGLTRLEVPTAWGGLGLGFAAKAQIAETLAAACFARLRRPMRLLAAPSGGAPATHSRHRTRWRRCWTSHANRSREAALASGLLLAATSNLVFRHELGRVAVASALSAPQAQVLHAQVLAALAGCQDAGGAVAPARLVHHALAARDRAAVSRHSPRAARQASERGAQREAAAQWRIALEHGQPREPFAS